MWKCLFVQVFFVGFIVDSVHKVESNLPQQTLWLSFKHSAGVNENSAGNA